MVLSTKKDRARKTVKLSEIEDSNVRKSDEQIEDFSRFFSSRKVIANAAH